MKQYPEEYEVRYYGSGGLDLTDVVKRFETYKTKPQMNLTIKVPKSPEYEDKVIELPAYFIHENFHYMIVEPDKYLRCWFSTMSKNSSVSSYDTAEQEVNRVVSYGTPITKEEFLDAMSIAQEYIKNRIDNI